MRAFTLLAGAGLIPVLGFTGPEDPPQDLVARGKSLYGSLCQRCHGANGDDTGYSGIVPLSGIDRRIDRNEIPRLSAPFVGKTFEGEEAEALVAYLATLKGEKGFEEPGSLFSPYLLERKLGEISSYRIIDVRPETDFQAGHIPNAIHWEKDLELGSQTGDLHGELDRLDIPAEVFMVICDGDGGSTSTALWWAFHQAGSDRVAVLDGGLQNWLRQGFRLANEKEISRSLNPSSAVAPVSRETRPLILNSPDMPDHKIRFEWWKTLDEEGFRPAGVLEEYLRDAGLTTPGVYRVEQPGPELGHLAFILHLLGYRVSYDSDHNLLDVQGGSRQTEAG